jgi:hypothetical protein
MSCRYPDGIGANYTVTLLIRKDIGKIEEILEQPGDLEVVATVRFLRKNGRVFVEIESEEGISRRTLKKTLRRVSLEIPAYGGESFERSP